MIKRIVKLVLLISWMIIIFLFSNDVGYVSTKKSDGLIIRTVETVLGRELSDTEKDKWTSNLVMPVRKTAHIGEYFILGILIISNGLEYLNNKRKVALWSLGISFLYACSDEVHQLFVAGRSGQISDVLIDTIGAELGILVVVCVVRMWKKYEQKERIS